MNTQSKQPTNACNVSSNSGCVTVRFVYKLFSYRRAFHSGTNVCYGVCVCVYRLGPWQRLRARKYMCLFRDCIRAATALSLGRPPSAIHSNCMRAPLPASRAIRTASRTAEMRSNYLAAASVASAALRQFIVFFVCRQQSLKYGTNALRPDCWHKRCAQQVRI